MVYDAERLIIPWDTIWWSRGPFNAVMSEGMFRERKSDYLRLVTAKVQVHGMSRAFPLERILTSSHWFMTSLDLRVSGKFVHRLTAYSCSGPRAMGKTGRR